MSDRWDTRDEIERIRRVSDMLASAHANLRDRYARRAAALDLSILGLTAWLVSLVFVDPRINVSLTPPGIEPQIWTGLLAILAFFLSIVQLRVDWKGLSTDHRHSFETYTEVKREAGYLLAASAELDPAEVRKVLARYDLASAVGIRIPETEFLRQKRNHQIKIQLSKHLDKQPFALLPLTYLKLWLQANFGKESSDHSQP